MHPEDSEQRVAQIDAEPKKEQDRSANSAVLFMNLKLRTQEPYLSQCASVTIRPYIAQDKIFLK